MRPQAGVADLSAAQAVQGGWGLAMLGDKDGAAALLGAAAAAVQKVRLIFLEGCIKAPSRFAWSY